MNCKELTQKINLIKSKRIDFDQAFSEDNVEKSTILKKRIESLIREVKEGEILNLEKQYNEWHEVYEGLDSEYKLPSKEKISAFLWADPKFMELMEAKHGQGFTKLIIAPAPGFFSLNKFLLRIEHEIENNDGKNIYFDNTWRSMLALESRIRYFGSIENADMNIKVPVGGISDKKIRQNPEEYSICEGWMISFTTPDQKMLRWDDPDLETGHGRLAIRSGCGAKTYEEKYFSDKDEIYVGERSMIPQEYFALFAQKLFENYTKIGRKISVDDVDLLDSDRQLRVRFNDTYLSGEQHQPDAIWYRTSRRLNCESTYPNDSIFTHGVCSVVRRSVKH